MMTRRPKVNRYPDGTPKDDDRCAATITAKDPLTLFADGWARPCRRPRQRGYQYCWQHIKEPAR